MQWIVLLHYNVTKNLQNEANTPISTMDVQKGCVYDH